MFLLDIASAAEAIREWTSAEGKALRAIFVSFDGTNVCLKLEDGRDSSVALARLSLQDQTYVRTQVAARPLAARTWPTEVEVSSSSIEVKLIKDDPSARKYVYHSEAFQYTSQGKLLPSLMKEVARTFEATRKLVNALPWGITCQPPDGTSFYEAALYETRNDYIQAGGPTNSGGVYMTGDKIFKIPFESLGIKRLGKSYTKDENYRSDTLVHEITHQMMHDYLPYLPQWCIEGTAEFTEMMPYKAGKFGVGRQKEGLKDYLDNWRKRGQSPRLPDVAQLFRMNRETWTQQAQTPTRMGELYQQSALLVYYFNHLDGDGTGKAWLRFMDVTKEEIGKWQAFEKDFKSYRAALDEFFKLPGVEKLTDGRFSFPSNLTPPKPPTPPDGKDRDEQTPLKHLGLLLHERTEADLQREIAEKFKTLGVKLSL